MKDEIEDLIASLSTVLRAASSDEGKSHGFVGISDYLANTRVLVPAQSPSNAEYDAYVFNKFVANDRRLQAAHPALEFTSSLNKTSCTLDLGAGPFLVLDLHLEDALEDLTKVYFCSNPATAGLVTALRQLAENYVVTGDHMVAAVLAATASAFENEGYGAREMDVPGASPEVQAAYVIAHELGHLLWLRDGVPPPFAMMVDKLVRIDAGMAAEARMPSGGRPAGGADLYGPSEIEETIRRRSDPAGEFVQEIWADFYAWAATAREYTLGGFPPHTVFEALALALRNLATIDALRRIAERQGRDSTVDEVSARRHILRMLLRTHFGDLRKDDGYIKLSGIPPEALATADFNEISQETEDRYHRHVWDPMMRQLGGVLVAASNQDAVKASYEQLRVRFGDEPAVLILRDRPVQVSDLQ